MASDDVGPVVFDWTDAEYTTLITEQSDGVFGAYQNTVYTNGQLRYASNPTPENSTSVRGIVHNHPEDLDGGTELSRLNQRYPSPEDFDALDMLYTRYSQGQTNFDPAIWVLDSFGVTRKFLRSERAEIEALEPDDVLAGVGLEGREVNDDDC